MTGIQKLNWRVVVGGESFTPENPGNLKGAIMLDYNSVGACVGGTLTFEGYVYWAPFSEVISVFVDGVPIGYGVVGLVSTTRSETGKRTSTVPIVGMHAIDADGLAAVGLGGDYELLGIASPLDPIPTEVKETDALGFPVTKTILVDPPFGETVNAAFQRVFKDHPLASWGVRPNGRRVAGIPYGGPSISSGAVNVRAQPSNYELTSYVSEFMERPAERWKARTQTRNVGWLMPRHGATVQTDDLLGDKKMDAPLTLIKDNFDDGQAQSGSLVATLDLHALLTTAFNNPDAKDATYELRGVSMSVQVTFDHPELASAPPENWYGTNTYALGTWQDYAEIEALKRLRQRVQRGPQPEGPGELLEYMDSGTFTGFTTTQNPETKIIVAKDRAYFESVAMNGFYDEYPNDTEKRADIQKLKSGFPTYFNATYPPQAAQMAQEQWEYYRAQIAVNFVLAEWITKSGAQAAAPVIFESAPVIHPTQPTYPEFTGDKNSLGFVFYNLARFAWSLDPTTYQASNAQLDIDLKRDPGLLRGLYRESARLNTTNNRLLTWTFSVPKELIAQIDPDLPAGYKWACAVAYSGVRLGLKARAKVTATAMYQKVISGSTNVHRDVPAYEQQPLVTPTLQGVILGEIYTGPFTVDGQQMANARVVIEANGYRTEFQTGAANGGR